MTSVTSTKTGVRAPEGHDEELAEGKKDRKAARITVVFITKGPCMAAAATVSKAMATQTTIAYWTIPSVMMAL
jgi:hypothetical protein